MKKRKISLIVLTLIMGTLSCASFAACRFNAGGTNPGGTETECTHEWKNTAVHTDPTCTKAGSQEQKCTKCDETQTIEIAALEHSYGEWHDEVAATCTDDGTKGYRECSRCHDKVDEDGNTIEDLTIPAGHSYGEWHDEVAATCTDDGTKGYRECSRCHDKVDEDGNTIEDLTIPSGGGHSYGETTYHWETNAVGDYIDCIATRACSNEGCEYFESTRSIELQIGHFGSTCIAYERLVYTAKFEEAWAGTPGTDGDGNVYYGYIETVIVGTELWWHEVDDETLTYVLCKDEDGEETIKVTGTCSVCGEVSATIDRFTKMIQREATCPDASNPQSEITYFDLDLDEADSWVRNWCELETAPILEHKEGSAYSADDWTEEVLPGCMSHGVKGHYCCPSCNGNFDKDGNRLENLEIPNLGHTYMVDTSKGTNGYSWNEDHTLFSMYVVCIKCDESTGDHTMRINTIDIEELSHTDATCTSAETWTYRLTFSLGYGVWADGNGIVTITVVGNVAHETEGADWLQDDDKHWKVCVSCGKPAEEALHSYDETTHACVCGKVDPALSVATAGLQFSYDGKTKTYTVTGYTGTETEVKIPSLYNDGTNGYRSVVAIGENAFFNKTAITSVVVPDSVTSIACGAFGGCSSLESITLPFIGAKANLGQTEYRYPLGYIFGEDEYEGAVRVSQYYRKPADLLSTTTYYYIPETLQSVTVTGGEIGYGAFYNCNKLTSVTLGEGITSIGGYAFYACSSMQSVSIPDSVTTIGANAFFVCKELTAVKLPSKLTYIGRSAFGYCGKLASVVIPDTVTTVETYAFTDCKNLVDVTFPSGVTSIGESVFENCSSIDYNVYDNACYVGNENDPYIILVKAKDTSVTECAIASGTRVISAYAFRYCSALTGVTVPDGVLQIGQQAFTGCSKLGKIIIPDSVTTIGTRAFSDSGLQSVALGSGVTDVSDAAFQNCSSLTRVDITDLSAYLKISFNWDSSNPLYYAKNIYLNGELLTDPVIPEDVTEIKRYAFFNATCLKTLTVHSGVTKITNAFNNGCSNLTGVYITDLSAWMNIDFNSSPLFYAKNLYLNDVLLTELTIPDSFTEIKDEVFFGAECLEKVVIPEGVTSIGSDAFRSCRNLTSIVIPDSLTSLGSNVFYGCSQLNGDLYDNAYYLGNENNPHLVLLKATKTSITSCEIHKDTKFIAGMAFRSCDIPSITIPDGVTSIGEYAFEYSDLTAVVVPDSVTTLYSAAFSDCTQLERVTLSNKITVMGNSLFSGCTSLKSVVIPDSVTSVGTNVFKNCTSLETVTIGKGVTEIWNYAFSGCTSLKSVVIPDSVTDIYYSVFNGCTELTSVKFGNGLTYLSQDVFAGCSKLTEIVLPEIYTVIDQQAFENCTGLTTVTVHAGITKIEYKAFASCTSLTTIRYQGTMAQWGKIVKSSSWKNDTGEFTVICTDGTIQKADA